MTLQWMVPIHDLPSWRPFWGTRLVTSQSSRGYQTSLHPDM
ncbi:hypothetical protein LC2W_0312 [Lacticaseibacillus paracasei]|uniref:Uncharacterized protein n=1 Tax=Lacticaseibacillus paracasei subsp. paracasei Lpp22 TaxID=1256221 RepID=A0A8E0M4V4_LACPA|nr:hypothetical protein LC2W_0312 [Lacticaseibacillus paracasei]EPC17817.1 hypothetical protein Lpp226_2203 [Lacticaseibacillus paracasei subsp. paracasei Lpp226]EPC23197.1 hypothetical protein Lpp22_2300 [Lacticaseibacillus paracasei subsp. paracasei Lpp22]EPC30478.1 hypothetical protein Lpp223_2697 [Lacticaseibacillus paracasei subsp. paracasei Lpp223]